MFINGSIDSIEIVNIFLFLLTKFFRKNIENTDAYKMLSILYGLGKMKNSIDALLIGFVFSLVTFIGGVAFSISHAIIPEDEAEHIKHLAEVKRTTFCQRISSSLIFF